jgi:hypothetical protein
MIELGVTIGLAFIIMLVRTTRLVKASSGLKIDDLERAISWYRTALHTTSEDNLLNIPGLQYLYEIRNSSENSNRSRKQDGKRSELSKKP